jgi:ADP-ribose pyrophosphatase
MVWPEFELFEVRDVDGWKKLSAQEVYADPYIQIERVKYRTPNRQEVPVPWTVAHRKCAVAVVPVLEDGRFVLISQERLPVQQILWEFPAGQIDEPLGHLSCRSIAETVVRELREETGCELHPETGVLEPMGWFFPSQGFTDEHVYLFRAQPVCVVSRPESDGSEYISAVRYVSAGELRRMIADNEITNALTLALFARMAAKGWI